MQASIRVIGAVLALSGFSAVSLADSGQDQYQRAREQAMAAQGMAAAAGGEWRDVGKLLDEAQQAADAGDFSKAVKLAETAKRYSQLGQAQASSQQAGYLMPSVLK